MRCTNWRNTYFVLMVEGTSFIIVLETQVLLIRFAGTVRRWYIRADCTVHIYIISSSSSSKFLMSPSISIHISNSYICRMTNLSLSESRQSSLQRAHSRCTAAARTFTIQSHFFKVTLTYRKYRLTFSYALLCILPCATKSGLKPSYVNGTKQSWRGSAL